MIDGILAASQFVLGASALCLAYCVWFLFDPPGSPAAARIFRVSSTAFFLLGAFVWFSLGRFADDVLTVRAALGVVAVYTILFHLDLNFAKGAQNRMKLQEEFRVAVMENSIAAIIVADEAFNIVSWNNTATRTFGWTSEEAVGQPLTLLIPPAWQAHCRTAFKQYTVSGGRKLLDRSVRVTATHKAGHMFPVELSVIRYNRESNGTYYLGFMRDLSAKKAVEDRYQHLLTASMQAEVNERHRIADELHDDVVQVMVASLMRLDMAKRGLSADSQQSAGRNLDHAIETLRSATDRTRMLMFDLHGQSLADGGLCRALNDLAKSPDFSDFEVAVRCPLGRVDPLLEELLFRSIREALVNCRKHSRARRIRVEVEAMEGRLTASVNDDGVGFVVGEKMELGRRKFHRGLAAMRERIMAGGGQLDIFSSPGIGCTVFITMPLVAGDPLEPLTAYQEDEEDVVAHLSLPVPKLRRVRSRTGR